MKAISIKQLGIPNHFNKTDKSEIMTINILNKILTFKCYFLQYRHIFLLLRHKNNIRGF